MQTVIGLRGIHQAIRESFANERPVQIAGVSDALAQGILASLLADLGAAEAGFARQYVIVLPSAKDFGAWSGFLDYASTFVDPSYQPVVAVLPYYSGWANDRYVNPALSIRQRVYALSSLLRDDRPSIVLTTLTALSQTTLSPRAMRDASFGVEVGIELDMEDLRRRLLDLGYREVPTVADEGCFALRGGIFDVFPTNENRPVRIEFIGESVASMRHFDVRDQKSVEALQRCVIAPASEILLPERDRRADAQLIYDCLIEQDANPADRDGMMRGFVEFGNASGLAMFYPLVRKASATAFDFLRPRDATWIFPKAIDPCISNFKNFCDDVTLQYEQDRKSSRPVLPPSQHFVEVEQVIERVGGCVRRIEMGNPYSDDRVTFIRLGGRNTVPGAPAAGSFGSSLFDKWMATVERVLKDENGAVAIMAHYDEQLERIQNLLKHRSLEGVVEPQLMRRVVLGQVEPGRVYLGRGDLAAHLWLEDSALLVIPEQALFGSDKRKNKPASTKLQNYLNSFRDLKVGGLVVHVHHGIGRYLGMVTLTVGGVQNDFLQIEYAGGDKIYLPVDRLSMLQRYNAGLDESASAATLDKLKGQDWDKRKARVKKAIQDMADQLLRIQAQRKISDAHAASAPGESYFKFEAEFPYDETDDQLKAIADVNADLSRVVPMDRLVCGDVGFGKTEVALRAAMRIALDGQQTLVLVPTTVLCYQHYRTFKARLEKHGIRVGQVNRFVAPAEIKATLADLESGKLDIIIGTHRLLSKDIKPKKIGLLIVDEEQRFGVTHKEKIKAMRAGCHVLTMTATPIPRTLHMAMVGLRDISIIATPPVQRLAVRTYIAKYDEALIRDAIRDEIARGGQVFFVHNRVEDIAEMRNFLKSLLPEVDIRVGHGQMPEHQLEQVILDFIEQRFPVMVCTTIIESGIDMPNVNTLIVNRADRFGLSQLYQLRGRVGRASRQAFAYFLTPARSPLTDDAQKRLDVLGAHQELGAGFQIASYDLELRGAGNLLGGEQSGHVSAIGLELYTEMLESAILEQRGKQVREKIDTEIKIPISALIPAQFVSDEGQRLQLYKSLFSAASAEELQALQREVVDRFGPMPSEFSRLFKVAELKRLLKACGATVLSPAADGHLEIKFGSLSEKQIDRVIALVGKHPEQYRLAPDYKLHFSTILPRKPTLSDQDRLLSDLIALLEPVSQALEEDAVE